MARFQQLDPLHNIFFADHTTNIILPAGATQLGGQPLTPGYEIVVVDNLQLASGTNPIVINGTFAEAGTIVRLDVAGGSFRFTWTGSFFMMG